MFDVEPQQIELACAIMACKVFIACETNGIHAVRWGFIVKVDNMTMHVACRYWDY